MFTTSDDALSFILTLSWILLYKEARGGYLVAQAVKNLPAVQENQVWSLGLEDTLFKDTTTHSSVLAWEYPMDRGAWQATVNRIAKESDTTEWLTLSLHTKKQINIIGGPAVKCWPGSGNQCNTHSLTHEPCQSLHFKKIYFRIRVGIRMETWCYLPFYFFFSWLSLLLISFPSFIF